MNAAFREVIAAAADARRDLFLTTAGRLGTAVQNVEKDYWVCWTLDALFNGLPERETARHERASHDYAATGSKILELAKNAHSLFIRQDPREQARLLRTLVSNCTFDRGSLSVAYVKPFDLLVDGNKTGDWLGRRDSNPNNR